MSKKLFSIICGSVVLVSGGLALSTQTTLKSGLAQGQDNLSVEENINVYSAEATKEEDTSSIQLNPGMFVPEKETFLNQEVAWEDVYKTLNLGSMEEALKDALVEVNSGYITHLGRDDDKLTEQQIADYNTKVLEYEALLKEVSLEALDDQPILDVLYQFRGWVAEYSDSIDKAEQEELARLKREEEEKALEEVVVPDHTPKVTTEPTHHVSYGIPELGDQYLTYMPYTAITAKTTPHYRLQQIATTDSHGYRIHEGAVCIALASSYGTTIGTLYDITFTDGKVMRAILGDNKSDKHTDANKQYRDASGIYDGSSGNILEIIFDTNNYPDMNSVNRKINGDYPAEIASIVKVGMAEGFGE